MSVASMVYFSAVLPSPMPRSTAQVECVMPTSGSESDPPSIYSRAFCMISGSTESNRRRSSGWLNSTIKSIVRMVNSVTDVTAWMVDSCSLASSRRPR